VQNIGNRGTAGHKFTFPSREKFFNFGNGFDWNNQWFLAPYPGTYFFSLSGTKGIWSDANTQRRASIFVDLKLSALKKVNLVGFPSNSRENWKKVTKLNLSCMAKVLKFIFCLSLDGCWNKIC